MSREIEVHGLTERQAEVVRATIETGSIKRGCQQVGYDYRNAQRLFAESPGFQQAISEALKLAQIEDSLKARVTMRRLLDKSYDDSVKLRAAKDILDRGVGKAPDRVLHQHNHQHALDRDELQERVTTLVSELGMSTEVLPKPEPEKPETEEQPEQPNPYEKYDEGADVKPTLPRLK